MKEHFQPGKRLLKVIWGGFFYNDPQDIEDHVRQMLTTILLHAYLKVQNDSKRGQGDAETTKNEPAVNLHVELIFTVQGSAHPPLPRWNLKYQGMRTLVRQRLQCQTGGFSTASFFHSLL